MPELSSSTSRMPCARSSDSITLAPRSLKLPVGMNHSHFSSTARAVQGAADQRRAALAQGDRFVGLERQRGAVAPEAARRRVDLLRG